jgi:hypothetical protein
LDVELTVRSPQGSVAGWRYQVVGSGAPTVATGDVATVTIPDGTSVTLRILPPAPKAGAAPAWRDDPTAYWPLDLAITWNGSQANVGDPYHQVDVTRGAAGALRLSVVLSRVRDATATFDALSLPDAWPAESTSSFLFARRNGPRAAGVQPADLIDESAKIRRVAPIGGISTDDDLLLFEIAPPRKLVKGQEKLDLAFRPKLVGAYVGTPVVSGNFLVYYYPQIDQDPQLQNQRATNNLRRDSDDPNDATLGALHYPKAFVHLWKQVYGKFFYRADASKPPGTNGDPWFARHWFMGGFAHQVAAAARPLGVVIPVVDLEPTAFDAQGNSLALGVAVIPEDMHEIVREIWAHVRCLRVRRGFASLMVTTVRFLSDAAKAAAANAKTPDDTAAAAAAVTRVATTAQAAADCANRPSVTGFRKDTVLDRVMVAAFSNGNHYLSQLTDRIVAMSSPSSLAFREFCSLDAPSIYNAVEQKIRAACDKLPGSRAYYYWKYGYDVATRENGKPRTLKGGATVYQTVLEGRFVYTHLPAAAWPATPNDDLDMHAWVDSTMVCDALKCSAFPADLTKAVP